MKVIKINSLSTWCCQSPTVYTTYYTICKQSNLNKTKPHKRRKDLQFQSYFSKNENTFVVPNFSLHDEHRSSAQDQ